jgi:hypothetical protein
LKEALIKHLPLFLICLFYMIGNDILTIYITQQYPDFDFYPLTHILIYIIQFYYAAGVFLIIFFVLYFIAYSIKNYRIKPFWRSLAINFKNKYLTAQQVYGSILIFLLMPLFFAFVAMYKRLIPFVHPFAWDQTFEHWDYVLHFNHLPWQLLQPILGHPAITEFLCDIYGLWFTVLAAIIIWQANTKEYFYRMQFFLTFLLSWIILGTGMAFYFSSAGPCYFHFYCPDIPDPYIPLMSYLYQAASPWVIDIQYSLLTHLETNTLVLGGGVSAMPSMHLAMATLCFLICSKHNKWLAILTFIFLILVLIASIHLAWHYAVDGYFAIIFTSLIWYCTGKVLRYFNGMKRGGNNNV